jgi:hypothetical protein
MTWHTVPREREMPATALQEGVRLLEGRVAALTEALQTLIRWTPMISRIRRSSAPSRRRQGSRPKPSSTGTAI